MLNVSIGGEKKLFGSYDITIIGGGPAGLTAGLYASRARINHILIEKNPIPGGQVMNTETVENYPGFPESIGGYELMAKFCQQAESFGANIVDAEVIKLSNPGNNFLIETDSGNIQSKVVILTSGANPRKLNIPGESEYTGKGVSYCATCDGALYRGKNVAVIGGGDAGIEESIFLTRFANKVTIIEIMEHLGATKIIQEKAQNNPKIEILLSHTVVEITGDDSVNGLIIENRADGSMNKLDVEGIFIYAGIEPNVDFVAIDDLEKDKNGFVITDNQMRTNIPGLFAAGDVRAKLLRQISTAVGDGATAEFAAQKFLENRN